MSPRNVSCKTTPRQATPAAPIKRLIRQPANGEMPARGLGAPPLLRRGRTDRPETKPLWPTFAASSTIHKQIRPNSPVANVDLATRGQVKAEEAQPGRDQSQQHTDQATNGR